MAVNIRTEELTDTVGVDVQGVSIDQLLHDPDIPQWVHSTLEATGVLVFRELHLDDAAHIAFSKRLGQVEVFGKGENAEIFRVTLDPAKNPVAAYLRGTFDWHIDGLTDDIPIKATLLAAHGVADSGGETEFASTYAAYNALTAEEQQRFDAIRVVHSIEATQRRLERNPTPEMLAMWRARPSKTQPLIWHHHDGRKSVVLGPTAESVEGMSHAAGEAMLAALLQRSTAPDRVYRHEWKLGDLVIWDNRGVLHRALPYDPMSPRDMHRTTLTGDEQIQSS